MSKSRASKLNGYRRAVSRQRNDVYKFKRAGKENEALSKESEEKRRIREQGKQIEYDQAERECPEELKKILREKPYALRYGRQQEG